MAIKVTEEIMDTATEMRLRMAHKDLAHDRHRVPVMAHHHQDEDTRQTDCEDMIIVVMEEAPAQVVDHHHLTVDR